MSVPLTERQEQVLALMLEKKNHWLIAYELDLNPRTVGSYMIGIWDRLVRPENAVYASGIFRRLAEISCSQKATFYDAGDSGRS